MKTLRVVTVLLLLTALAAASPYGPKEKAATGRLLTGGVLDKHENPISDAVVYLTNTRTRDVKTYIVGPDGAYHFPELSPNIDYEVYAAYKGQKSDTKTVSQFDNRKQVNIVLHIDVK